MTKTRRESRLNYNAVRPRHTRYQAPIHTKTVQGPRLKAREHSGSQYEHMMSSVGLGDVLGAASPSQVRQDVACDPLVRIPKVVDRILPFRLARRVEVVRRTSTVQPIQRDAPADLRRVYVCRGALVGVAQDSDCVVHLRLIRSVEVVDGAPAYVGAVEQRRRHSREAEREPHVAFVGVRAVVDGKVHLVVVRGVEVVCALGAVGAEEGRCRVGVATSLQPQCQRY